MSTDLVVSYKGATYNLSLDPTSTLAAFATQLHDTTGVPASHQKLVYKGKRPSAPPETTLQDAGIRSGVKIMLIGPSSEELAKLQSAETEVHRREAILAQRAASGPSKVRVCSECPCNISTDHLHSQIRSTGKPSSSTEQFRFHKIVPLPHLPNPAEATKILTKIANDPAIRHVMIKHEFVVGTLTELAPHEHPNLLGLNENSGQVCAYL